MGSSSRPPIRQANDNIYLWREPDKAYCREVAGVFPVMEAIAPVDVPDGAALSDFKYWAYDEEANYNLTFNLLETCTTTDGLPPRRRPRRPPTRSARPGYYFGFKPLNNYVVHRDRCSLTVHVLFSEPDVTCHSDRLQVQKVQVSWVRQVSPAARRGDVQRRADEPSILSVHRGSRQVRHHRRLRGRELSARTSR